MKPRWLILAAGLAVATGVPLAGKWLRDDSIVRCAFDGLKIEDLYRVRVIDPAGAAHEFCCIRCARLWRTKQGDRSDTIYVTDETSRNELEARTAIFVQSLVPTNRITGNTIHAFRDRADAEAHARAFHGAVLTAEERPFP